MDKRILLVIFLTLFLISGCFEMSSGDKNNEVQSDSIPYRNLIFERLGDPFEIDVSDDEGERQFPFVYKFDNSIFISHSEHPDKVIASPTDALLISRDNGITWDEKITNKDFYFTSMFKKQDTLYALTYYTYHVSQKQEKMIFWTSTDNGNTWLENEGIVNAPEDMRFKNWGNRDLELWGSMLFHRGMMVMEDGSIQGVMYGHMSGDDKYRVVWVKSDDNCRNWEIISTIASGIPTFEGISYDNAEGFCEPSFYRVKDGSILCVMRIGSYLPLFQSRSKDKGKTWSAPEVLPGLPDSAVHSVDPNLLLMNNGVLALSYGRPHNKIAFSVDGSGNNWDYNFTIFDDVTTGYSGIIEVGKDSILMVADQGAEWSEGVKTKAIRGQFLSVKVKD